MSNWSRGSAGGMAEGPLAWLGRICHILMMSKISIGSYRCYTSQGRQKVEQSNWQTFVQMLNSPNGSYVMDDVKKWTYSCPSFINSCFIICKHLVQIINSQLNLYSSCSSLTTVSVWYKQLQTVTYTFMFCSLPDHHLIVIHSFHGLQFTYFQHS